MATTAGSGREDSCLDGQRRGRPRSPSRVFRRFLKERLIPEWAAECARVHAVGIEAERREREECRRDGEELEAAGWRGERARKLAVRREVEKGRLPLDAGLREEEIEARVREALSMKPAAASRSTSRWQFRATRRRACFRGTTSPQRTTCWRRCAGGALMSRSRPTQARTSDL